MQHAQPVTSSFPWRAATLVVGAVAAIELVALIGIGAVRLAPHAKNPAGPVKPKARAVQARKVAPPVPSHPLRRRERVRVLVLNGNGVQGAAASAASLVRARGYSVLEVGNAQRTGYARTIVMYRPHFRAEALRFQHDLNLSIVAPLDGMTLAELKGAHLVEILGAAR